MNNRAGVMEKSNGLNLDFNLKKKIVMSFLKVGVYRFFCKCKFCGSKNMEVLEKRFRTLSYFECQDCKNWWWVEEDSIFDDKDTIDKIISIIECFIKNLNEKEASDSLDLDYEIVDCFYKIIRFSIFLHVNSDSYINIIKKNNLKSIKKIASYVNNYSQIDIIKKLRWKFVENFDSILNRDISDNAFTKEVKNDFKNILSHLKDNRLISFFLFFDNNNLYINEVYNSSLERNLKEVACLMDYNLLTYLGKFRVDSNIIIYIFHMNDLSKLLNNNGNVKKTIDDIKFIKKAQNFWISYGNRLLELYNLNKNFRECVKEIELRYNQKDRFKNVVLKAVNRSRLYI